MIIPFNHQASKENFPLPEKVPVLVRKGIKETSNITKENAGKLLWYIPSEKDVVIFSDSPTGSTLRDIAKILRKSKERILEWKCVVIAERRNIYTLPTDLFFEKSMDDLYDIGEYHIDEYLLATDISSAYVPEKFFSLWEAIKLLQEYDPLIVEKLGGIDIIQEVYLPSEEALDELKYQLDQDPTKIEKLYGTGFFKKVIAAKESNNQEEVKRLFSEQFKLYSYFSSLIRRVYIHLLGTQTDRYTYQRESVEDSIQDILGRIRCTLYPDFIATFPEIKKWESSVFTSRYRDIEIIKGKNLSKRLSYYGYDRISHEFGPIKLYTPSENEMILKISAWAHINDLMLEAVEILEFYPKIEAIICNHNGRIFRFPRDVKVEENVESYIVASI